MPLGLSDIASIGPDGEPHETARTDLMKNEQRALQLWSILVLAALNRQTLTYMMVSKLTGLHLPSVGDALFPIQYYCKENKLPPLTVLVVREKDGIPGDGLPYSPAECARSTQEVFSYDWSKHNAPGEDEFTAPRPKKRRRSPA